MTEPAAAVFREVAAFAVSLFIQAGIAIGALTALCAALAAVI